MSYNFFARADLLEVHLVILFGIVKLNKYLNKISQVLNSLLKNIKTDNLRPKSKWVRL